MKTKTVKWNGRDVKVRVRSLFSGGFDVESILLVEGTHFKGTYASMIEDEAVTNALLNLEKSILRMANGVHVKDLEAMLKTAKDDQGVAEWLVKNFNIK